MEHHSKTLNPNLPPQLQSLHSCFASFLDHVSSNPLVSNIQSTIQTLTKSIKPPGIGRAAPTQMSVARKNGGEDLGLRMTTGVGEKEEEVDGEDMGDRFKGVPVYLLGGAEESMMLLSGVNSGKSLGLMCFKEEDAEALLQQMKLVSPQLHQGTRVMCVGLDQVVNLKVNDVAFRFIPDSHQILNAVQTTQQFGDTSVRGGFAGVPVFLSRSLAIKSRNKRYRPAFLRKEDLEKTFSKTSKRHAQETPALRKKDIQVCTLEDIISDMKEGKPTSEWSDVIFVPPGFEVTSSPGDGPTA